MPELPDIEGFRRVLADHAAGREVRAVTVPDEALLEGTTPQGLGQALRGRRLAEPRRHGKWLLGPTEDGPLLLFHFRMTGELVWADDGEHHAHDRVVLRFDEGELRYREQRRLGRLWLVRRESEVTEVTGELGPDAQEVDRQQLGELLAGRQAMVKSALMDQRRLAGVGNELSDEVLWDARLNPRTRTDELSEADLDRLHGSLHRVLERSVAAGRIPEQPGWLESQRGADDPRCPRCGTALRRATVAGRTAHWCPNCQPG
jgi:formamidopyrimidine-DNA glycosylase